MKRFGVGLTLAFLPLLSIAGFMALGAAPVFAVFVVFQVLRRAGNFALAVPAREVLYTVLAATRDKYKAKNFNDTFVYRAGDQIGSVVVRGVRRSWGWGRPRWRGRWCRWRGCGWGWRCGWGGGRGGWRGRGGRSAGCFRGTRPLQQPLQPHDQTNDQRRLGQEQSVHLGLQALDVVVAGASDLDDFGLAGRRCRSSSHPISLRTDAKPARVSSRSSAISPFSSVRISAISARTASNSACVILPQIGDLTLQFGANLGDLTLQFGAQLPQSPLAPPRISRGFQSRNSAKSHPSARFEPRRSNPSVRCASPRSHSATRRISSRAGVAQIAQILPGRGATSHRSTKGGDHEPPPGPVQTRPSPAPSLPSACPHPSLA